MIKNELKYSGIFWLGNIPEKWIIKRIKDLTTTKSGTTPATNVVDYYENGKHNWIRTTDLNDSELFDTEYKLSDLALEKCRLSFLPIDTVLVAMYGGFGTIGKNAILKKASTINQSVCAILPSKKNLDSNYLLYFLKYFRADWRLFADGTRKDPNINQDAVKNLFIIYPTLSEQTAIASYLDQKTSAIDRKVSLLEQKITHYQQLRKSLINETVCRGLDKNVKLKDSGIEWIGMIPKHWEVRRLKDVCAFINRGTPPTYDETGSFKVVNQATFSKGFWDESSLRFSQSLEVKPRGLLKENDILIASTGGGVLGKVFFFKRKESGYIADSHITILRDNRKNYFSKFVYYYFSEKFKLINDILAKGSTNQTELQKDWLLAFFICIPPQLEQTSIATYLDEKTQKIDLIITNITTQIATLKELRKTLINDVVTGKLKVSE